MRVVAGFVGSLLLVASLSCSEAPPPIEPAAEKPTVEAPKFAVAGPKSNTPAPRAFAPANTPVSNTAPATVVAVVPAVPPANPSSLGAAAAIPGLDLARRTFEGRPIQLPSVADGYPVHTLPGPDAKTVMLVRPGTLNEYPFPMEKLGTNDRFTRVIIGSTNILTLSTWQPGTDLYLSPKQMFEAFPPAPAPAPAGDLDLKSVMLTKADAVVPLPGNVIAVGVGGGYLLLSLREPNRVVVVDVAKAKIAATIPIDADLFHVAGGAARFFALKPAKNEISAYDFAKLNSEPQTSTESELQFHQYSRSIAMGRNSLNPLMLHDSEGLGFLRIDAGTLRPIRKDEKQGAKFSSKNPDRLSARHDGSTFYLGTDEGPTREFRFYREITNVDEKTKRVSYYDHVREESLLAAKQNVLSRTDGTGLYVYGDRELCFRNGLRVGNRSRFDHIVPCSPPGFWLAAGNPSPTESVVGIDLFFGSDPLPLETVYLAEGGKRNDDPKHLPLRDRIVHLPEQKKLAIVTADPPSVLLKAFRPEEKLQAAKRPTLLVTSTPPLPLFSRNDKLEYQIQVAALPGPVAFQLVKGPPELTVSAQGLVKWQPKSSGGVPFVSDYALIKISDPSGRFAFERLDLVVKANPY